MKPGDFAEVTRRYAGADMAEFADLAGGALPDHVPEPLIGALFSYLLGVKLPGFGTNYLKQSLNFRGAAPLDVPLTARVEITRLRAVHVDVQAAREPIAVTTLAPPASEEMA